MEEIQHKLHKHFPSLPQNALRKIYKTRCERLRLLMINGVPSNIRWLIEATVRLAGEFSDPFVSFMPGFGKRTFAKKMRAKRLGSKCHNCVRLNCNQPDCKSLGMGSDNHEDKIKFVKDGLSKESLDDIFDLLRRIKVDMCNVRFIICGYYSKKKVYNLVLEIWLKKAMFASL